MVLSLLVQSTLNCCECDSPLLKKLIDDFAIE